MISHNQSRMDGFILRFSVVAMAYRNQAESPMTSCAHVFRRRGNTRHPQHLVSGAINGAPFNLSYSLTTSASNMWRNNTPYISSRIWSRTMRSPPTGKGGNCRNRPCMGLQLQARQLNLPHLHGWVHLKSAPQIWTPLPQKTTTLTTQTS